MNKYKNIKSVVAIILKGNKILLGRCLNGDDRYLKYCFPGGGREQGEFLFDTAERETYEETNLKVEALSTNPIISKDDNSVVYIFCKYIEGETSPSNEFSNFIWHDINNNLPKETYSKNIELLNIVKRLLTK